MSATANKLETLEALRLELARRFREALPETRPEEGPALGSGLEALDAILPHGGLRPGESARFEAAPGAGALGVLSSFARNAVKAGEAVAVVDASPHALPHPWVEPEGAEEGSLWVVTPEAHETWAAVDVLLRSGAFGLVIVVDARAASRDVGLRATRLVRQRRTRLLVTGPKAFPTTFEVALRLASIEWDEAPLGAVPSRASVEASCDGRRALLSRDAPLSDRLRLPSVAPDRRASHSGKGRARDRSGPRARRD